ncbi:proprotein convertase P-domain-containing protein [Nannocystaceae bacterium ST9]
MRRYKLGFDLKNSLGGPLCLSLGLGLAACTGGSTDDDVGSTGTDTGESTGSDDPTAESSSGMTTGTSDSTDSSDSATTATDGSTDGSTDSTTDASTDSTDSTTGGGVCGNGAIEDGEQCDTGDLGGATCQTEGFGGGGLTCTADCVLDTSQCTDCGNGMVDGMEECDGADLGDNATCADLNLGTAMEPLGCKDDCTYDFGMCSGCGDAVINDPEECEPAGQLLDKDDLNGQTCMSIGFDDGLLSCSPGCTFNTDSCYNCGDAVQQGNEECDGADFGSTTCADFLSPSMAPFDTGSLSCIDDCTIDTSNCSLCGDGVVTGAEICEPGVLQGETCGSQGFDDGVLGCNADCTGFDVSNCTDCGDGMVEGNEQCEANDLAGETCNTLGFLGGGTLACSNTCTFNTGMCTNEFCGDGIKNSNDQCDCGNQGINCTAAQLGNQTCSSQGFSGGALACNSPNNCQFDTGACYSCGDGAINPGEQCDGANLGGATCVSQGFLGGGTLSCNGSCGFNTAQCVNVANPYVACANPGTAIPGSGLGVASSINIPAGGTVTDVNISITALHTWVGDLTWTLTKGATNRVMINRVTNGGGGCSSDNIGVTLDDESAGGSVQTQCSAAPPAIGGNRTPNATLNGFDNTSMVGNWTLQPNDLAAGDSGTFQQWCITVTWQ